MQSLVNILICQLCSESDCGILVRFCSFLSTQENAAPPLWDLLHRTPLKSFIEFVNLIPTI